MPQDQTHGINPQQGGQLAREGPNGHARCRRGGSQSKVPAVVLNTGSGRRGQCGRFRQVLDSFMKTWCQMGSAGIPEREWYWEEEKRQGQEEQVSSSTQGD